MVVAVQQMTLKSKSSSNPGKDTTVSLKPGMEGEVKQTTFKHRREMLSQTLERIRRSGEVFDLVLWLFKPSVID